MYLRIIITFPITVLDQSVIEILQVKEPQDQSIFFPIFSSQCFLTTSGTF